MSYTIELSVRDIDADDVRGLVAQALDAGADNFRIVRLFGSWTYAQPDDQLMVAILNDDGEVDMEETITVQHLHKTIAWYAASYGMSDQYESTPSEFVVDFGAIDIFNALNIFQYAAFGEVVIS